MVRDEVDRPSSIQESVAVSFHSSGVLDALMVGLYLGLVFVCQETLYCLNTCIDPLGPLSY